MISTLVPCFASGGRPVISRIAGHLIMDQEIGQEGGHYPVPVPAMISLGTITA